MGTVESDRQTTWETYVRSWKAESAEEKRALYEASLDRACVYLDPLARTEGWDELVDYMIGFHQQLPGAYFHTVEFLEHTDASAALWELRTGEGEAIGTGVSFGRYNDDGKLVAMTGFYEVPAN